MSHDHFKQSSALFKTKKKTNLTFCWENSLDRVSAGISSAHDPQQSHWSQTSQIFHHTGGTRAFTKIRGKQHLADIC